MTYAITSIDTVGVILDTLELIKYISFNLDVFGCAESKMSKLSMYMEKQKL
jgi:hypothetical protein